MFDTIAKQMALRARAKNRPCRLLRGSELQEGCRRAARLLRHAAKLCAPQTLSKRAAPRWRGWQSAWRPCFLCALRPGGPGHGLCARCGLTSTPAVVLSGLSLVTLCPTFKRYGGRCRGRAAVGAPNALRAALRRNASGRRPLRSVVLMALGWRQGKTATIRLTSNFPSNPSL